jgi:DNA-binding NarL/FixJ family response regulator
MKKLRLLLVDDHTILLEGLTSLLSPVFDLVGTASNGREAVEAAERLRPDIVLLDVSMPVLNGIEAARQLHESNPGARLIMLSMHSDPSFVRAAFEAGASGYLLKRSAATELVNAIYEVARGRRYISGLIPQDLGLAAAGSPKQPRRPIGDLSPREREVLQLLAEGRVRKEIAEILGISVKTVEFHKHRIIEKLGIHTTAELTAYAIRHGITAG